MSLKDTSHPNELISHPTQMTPQWQNIHWLTSHTRKTCAWQASKVTTACSKLCIVNKHGKSINLHPKTAKGKSSIHADIYTLPDHITCFQKVIWMIHVVRKTNTSTRRAEVLIIKRHIDKSGTSISKRLVETAHGLNFYGFYVNIFLQVTVSTAFRNIFCMLP